MCRHKLPIELLQVLVSAVKNPPDVHALAVPDHCKHIAGKWDLTFDPGAEYHGVGNIEFLLEIKAANQALRLAANQQLGVIGMGTLHAKISSLMGTCSFIGRISGWLLFFPSGISAERGPRRYAKVFTHCHLEGSSSCSIACTCTPGSISEFARVYGRVGVFQHVY